MLIVQEEAAMSDEAYVLASPSVFFPAEARLAKLTIVKIGNKNWVSITNGTAIILPFGP